MRHTSFNDLKHEQVDHVGQLADGTIILSLACVCLSGRNFGIENSFQIYYSGGGGRGED